MSASPAGAAIGGGVPVTIDGFATNQSALTLTFPPAGTTAATSVSGADILGGERDLQLALNGGVIAGNGSRTAVSSGLFSYSQDATISGNARLSWDGIDGSPTINPTGLGGVDLTAGGSQDALDLSTAFDDLPITVSVMVFTDTAHFSIATVSLPGLIFSSSHFVVPFSAFVPLSGGGADFTDVGAIHMTVGSDVTAPDLVLDELTTDALLKAPMTVALTGDANGNGLGEAGDELTYTTTIENPADAIGATSEDVTFAFSPPAGTTLVSGSVTTSGGTVTSGNGGGDAAAGVAVGEISDGGAATVTAKVTIGVHPTSPLAAQATIGSKDLTALKTDDPDASGREDPTTFAVVENRPPTAVDDVATTVGGTSLTDPAPGVLSNDEDPDGDRLTAALVTGPAHGQLTLDPDGGYRYTPTAGFTGSDSFTYVADDGIEESAPATVRIAVEAPPVVPPVDEPVRPTETGPLPAPPTAAPVAPASAPKVTAPKAVCASRRTLRVLLPRSARKATRATVTISGRKGRRVAVRGGRVAVDLRGAPRGKYTVKVRVGKRTVTTRYYKTCRRPSESSRG